MDLEPAPAGKSSALESEMKRMATPKTFQKDLRFGTGAISSDPELPEIAYVKDVAG